MQNKSCLWLEIGLLGSSSMRAVLRRSAQVMGQREKKEEKKERERKKKRSCIGIVFTVLFPA